MDHRNFLPREWLNRVRGLKGVWNLLSPLGRKNGGRPGMECFGGEMIPGDLTCGRHLLNWQNGRSSCLVGSPRGLGILAALRRGAPRRTTAGRLSVFFSWNWFLRTSVPPLALPAWHLWSPTRAQDSSCQILSQSSGLWVWNLISFRARLQVWKTSGRFQSRTGQWKLLVFF